MVKGTHQVKRSTYPALRPEIDPIDRIGFRGVLAGAGLRLKALARQQELLLTAETGSFQVCLGWMLSSVVSSSSFCGGGGMVLKKRGENNTKKRQHVPLKASSGSQP